MSDGSDSDTKQCRTCGEPIKASARKCVHCGSYQDWRDRLSLSSMVLVVIVPLVTITTGVLGIITWFGPGNSHEPDPKSVPHAGNVSLKFATQIVYAAKKASGSQTQIASVDVYNAGQDSAFVKEAGLWIDGAKGGNWRGGSVAVDEKATPAPLPLEIPGKSHKTIRFDLGNHEEAIGVATNNWARPLTCKLNFTYLDAANTPRTASAPVDCEQIWGVQWQ